MKIKILLHFIIISLLIGCSNSKKGPMKGRKEIIIIPQENINKGMALRVYIVQCYSEETANEMKSIESEEFFSKKQQLALNYPEHIKIWEMHIEQSSCPVCIVVPNQKRYWTMTIFFGFVDNVESKYQYPETARSVEFIIKDGEFSVSNNNKKYVYSTNKYRQWICAYLSFNDCIGSSKIENYKTRKYN